MITTGTQEDSMGSFQTDYENGGHAYSGPDSDLCPYCGNIQHDCQCGGSDPASCPCGQHDDEGDDGSYTGPMAKDPWLPGPSGPAPF
ncbi:hypothetical protein SEA_SKOG_11 [Gordonia phage Skog]|uniref:Uncharacterized protein n=1 Tax=Gordonia phage Skog TaxID=2704033 RepID=A0A6G6XK61_9CAUD|nr:hypothetical protein KHQ85_gp011 [Gordonia phage Skog]QIG58163.1 hypothetical protein SEA_SKOG_11 [Gordonia phage Skog]